MQNKKCLLLIYLCYETYVYITHIIYELIICYYYIVNQLYTYTWHFIYLCEKKKIIIHLF